jgi:lactoylglutathione lyase
MSWQYDHTHFKCADEEKTAAFFQENFGAKEVARVVVNGMPIVTLEIGGCWYNFSPKRANETMDAATGTVRYGVYHVAFKTKDLDAEAAKMKARGVKFTQDVKPLNPRESSRLSKGPMGFPSSCCSGNSRLTKTTHPLRWTARAALRRTCPVRLAPAPILRMGTWRSALHLDLFERPGRNGSASSGGGGR